MTLKLATDEMARGSREKARAILMEAIGFLIQSGCKEKVEQALQMLNQLLAQIEQGVISSKDLKMYKLREFYSRRSSSRLPPGSNPLSSSPPGPPPPINPDKSGPGPVA